MIIVRAAFGAETEAETGVADPLQVQQSLGIVLQAIKSGSLSPEDVGSINQAIKEESVKARREGEKSWGLSPQVPNTPPKTWESGVGLGTSVFEGVEQEKKSSRNVLVRIAGFA